MITVKLSHSILSLWADGKWEDAVASYLGAPLPATPQMELGKIKHQVWAQAVEENRTKLPKELGGFELHEPIIEQKYQKIIPMGEKYQILLRGIIDCSDVPRIYEFKCGLGTPSSYLDSFQLDYYSLFEPGATEGVYLCHNPYYNTLSTGIKFLGRANREAALNHIVTYGGEIIDYLVSQNQLIDYKA